MTFSDCEWTETRLKWTARLNALLEGFHVMLDVVGFVPGVGEMADLTNGIIYSVQGEGLNATLSFAGMIPLAGIGATSARLGFRVFRGPSGRDITLKYLKNNVNEFLEFGYKGQLRRVLGLLKGDSRIAHRILPWAHRYHDVIQKAIKSADVTLPDGTVLKRWHMNDQTNGIPLDPAVHTGNHSTYSGKVQTKLNQINDQVSTNEDALKALKELTDQIRIWISNNPGVHIDNINLP